MHAKSLYTAVILLLTASLCQAQAIVAHRGASHDAPENTLAAFNLAWERGADAAEGDFHLSADGHIVCIHDKTTRRTAGVDLRVAKATLAELRKLDVGRWKHEKYAGERIATLEEVLATVPDGKQFFIEIKCGPEIVPALKGVLESTKLKREQLVVIAFNESVIAAVKEAMPWLKAHWLTGYKRDERTGEWSPSFNEVLATLKQINADGLDTNAHGRIDAAFVKRLRDAGYEFHCWTVNDPAVAKRFRALGVDSITTDRPAWLRERMKE